MARLVVIGGGAAGMSAASAARRVDSRLEVVVCEAGGFAAYGMCGIPYYLGGTVPEAENLLAYPPSTFREKRGIDLRLGTAVTGIDPGARQVRLAAGNGAAVTLSAEAAAEIAASRKVIEALADDSAPHYGVSTGFGALATKHIPPESRAQLQRSLVRSHAAGSGPEVEPEVTRAMMLA